jgi:hypothetical protein
LLFWIWSLETLSESTRYDFRDERTYLDQQRGRQMSGIQDIIQQQLSPDTIAQISQAIGADTATTQQAVNAAVPMLMGGMAANAATPDGAQALDSAAAEHSGMLDGLQGMLGNAGGLGGVLGSLGGMMQGGGSTGTSTGTSTGGLDGMLGGLGGMMAGGAGGILGNILGSHHSTVENGVTQASGLDKAKAAKLLMILGPIVLGAIAHHRKQTGASPAQITNDLQREAQAHASHPQFGGIIGSILNKATGQA